MGQLKDLYEQYQHDELVLLPDGEHRLGVVGCSVKDNSVTPIFRVVGGPDEGKRVMAGPQVLTEQSANIFFRNMKGFGLGRAFFEPRLDDVSALMQSIASALVGRVVDVTLTVEPYGTYKRNKIVIGAIKLVWAPDHPGDGTAAAVDRLTAAVEKLTEDVTTAIVDGVYTHPVPPPVAVED